MRARRALLVLAVLASAAAAHEAADQPDLILDTDAGLDDVVALTMALQHPDFRVRAIVLGEGAAGREAGLASLERLLLDLHRPDVPLHAPAAGRRPAPPFRATAEVLVRRLLPPGAPEVRRPFDPRAYVVEGRRTVVLALGPLTNLAAALAADPSIREGIREVIVSGSPETGWNVRHDPEALASVRTSGIPVEFVVPGGERTKPARWSEGAGLSGRSGTPGAALFRRLFADRPVADHYRGALGPLHDELAVLYAAGSGPFEETETPGVYRPRAGMEVARMVEESLGRGRLARRPTVFTDCAWPDELLREDVRERRAAILEKNGPDEWFAQVLLNEVHGHLGAYSVIGVKMGIRAAEILNAPLHAMVVESHVPPGPPASCLNDGVIVATGSTPGRDLLHHGTPRPDEVAVSFTHLGRTVTLRLRETYRARIRQAIAALLAEHGLEDEDYWKGVRRLGLEIWQDWHRADLFEGE